MVNGEYTIECC
jgi:hypothetical protein